MMVKKIFMLICLATGIQTASAVEFLVTDTSGTALNTTTSVLDLGDYPTPKTVQIWMTYTSDEATTINSAGGLWGGSSRLVFTDITAVRVYEPSSSSIINPSSQWSSFQRGINYTTGLAQAAFNRGSSVGLTLSSSATKILVSEFVISPGETINGAGSIVTLSLAGTNVFMKGDGTSINPITAIAVQPTNYQFLVVPEPSTYAFCLISTATLAAVSLNRRKKTVRQCAMTQC